LLHWVLLAVRAVVYFVNVTLSVDIPIRDIFIALLTGASCVINIFL